MDNDPIDRFTPAKLKSVSDWEGAISKTIPTEQMLDWFDEILAAHMAALAAGGRVRPEYLQLFCGAQKRFQELAYFSRKLTPEQRQMFKDQATTIVDLIADIWGRDADLMKRLEGAIAASTDRYKKFGWPNPVWGILDFEEL